MCACVHVRAQTDRQTNGQTDRQTNRQSDRQTTSEADSQYDNLKRGGKTEKKLNMALKDALFRKDQSSR